MEGKEKFFEVPLPCLVTDYRIVKAQTKKEAVAKAARGLWERAADTYEDSYPERVELKDVKQIRYKLKKVI